MAEEPEQLVGRDHEEGVAGQVPGSGHQRTEWGEPECGDDPEEKAGRGEVLQRSYEVAGMQGAAGTRIGERRGRPVLSECDRDPGQRGDDDSGDQCSQVTHTGTVVVRSSLRTWAHRAGGLVLANGVDAAPVV